MADIIQIQWTCESVEEAERISRDLVKRGDVACANIIPDVISIYRWNGVLTEDTEVKVLLKTTQDKFELVRDTILEQCSYELPEVTYTEIDGGNKEYLAWVKKESK